MIVSLISAMDKKRGIGKDNALPWAGKLPRDMKRFKDLTIGKSVIMGRKTFESVGKPLKDRMNIVLTRDIKWHHDGVWHVHSLDEAIEEAKKNGSSEEIFIIGGASLYEEALPRAQRMYLTEIDGEFACDAFFPEYAPKEWCHISLNVWNRDDRNAYKMRFLNLERKIPL